jgi:hypothetical protein
MLEASSLHMPNYISGYQNTFQNHYTNMALVSKKYRRLIDAGEDTEEKCPMNISSSSITEYWRCCQEPDDTFSEVPVSLVHNDDSEQESLAESEIQYSATSATRSRSPLARDVGIGMHSHLCLSCLECEKRGETLNLCM